jgi:uncharacterized membrane protein
MNAVVVVVALVLLVIVVTATALLLRSISASPKQEYRRHLKSIRRIRKGTHAGDPNATTIDVNSDAFHGS